jgi:hypothetical protein
VKEKQRKLTRLGRFKMTDIVADPPASPTGTNPILLRLFKLGWDDPSWGQLPVNQVAIGMILRDLGYKLADRSLQEQVQEIAQKIIIDNARPAFK